MAQHALAGEAQREDGEEKARDAAGSGHRERGEPQCGERSQCERQRSRAVGELTEPDQAPCTQERGEGVDRPEITVAKRECLAHPARRKRNEIGLSGS